MASPDTVQGVITCTSPAEASVTRIKNRDRQKLSLITWSLPYEVLDHLILWESKDKNGATPPSCLRNCIDISRSEFVLILWSALKKNADHLIPFLILVANAPTGDTYVTTPCSGLSRVVTPGNTHYWQLAALSSLFGTGLVPLGVVVVTITEKWLPHTVTTIDGFHSIFSPWRLESITSPCCLLIASHDIIALQFLWWNTLSIHQ